MVTGTLKILFIVGQCIRLLHSDPWQEYTYKVDRVGSYSYQVSHALVKGLQGWDSDPISFKEQKQYEAVDCPTDATSSDFK